MILEDFGDRVLKVKNKFGELTREDIESIYREAWAARCSKPDYSYAYEHVGVIAKQRMISTPLAFQIAGEAFNKLAKTREDYRKNLAGVAEETAREYADQFFPTYDENGEIAEPNVKLAPSRYAELENSVAPEVSRDEFQRVFRDAWIAYCDEHTCGDAYDLLADSGKLAGSLQGHAIMSAAFEAVENLEDEFYAGLKEQANKVAERMANWLYRSQKSDKDEQ